MQILKAAQDVILKKINSKYRKTLLVNFEDGTFKVGDLPNDEKAALKDIEINTIYDYWNWFCSSDLLDECSRDVCLKYKPHPDTRLIYRRKIENEFHMMLMEVNSLEEYPGHSLLTVVDINGIYEDEYKAVVDKIASTDTMTGLLNRYTLERDLKAYKGDYVGVVFADLNGLKWTNDNKGHAAGDELIVKFANLLAFRFNKAKCYHVSGDEFIVLSIGCSLREFMNSAIKLHKGLWNTEGYPMASIGYAVGEGAEIMQALKDAEDAMYDDKMIFKSKFPQYKRE